MKAAVEQILARLRDQNVEVPADEVESRMRLLVEKFGVPEGEATRSVVNYFLKEHGIAPASFAARKSESLKVGEINSSGRWIDLEAKVVELWEPTSSAISQTGLIGDETGTIKFVKWTKSELPDMELGKSYLFKNVVTDEFQGRFSVKLNRTSGIEPLEEEIEVSPQEAKFTGAIVDVQKGSGLIKRCPVCRRMLTKGVCGEHGKQEGTYDLRIKAVLDDGLKVQEVLINRERTESLIGISMEEAKTMAMEALDHEVVRGMIEERLLGRYYTVSGPTVDRYILVETISPVPPVTAEEADVLVERAQAQEVI
jgi:replication factor A1